MMLDRRLQKLGTLLGLLAIWLTVLAPPISQVLISRTSIEQSSYVECGARQGAAHYAHHAHYAGAGGSHRHDTFEHGQACGYCGFFAHLPLLPGLTPRVVPAFAAAKAAHVASAAVPWHAERVYTAQPRAPPAVS
ncbi:DUF2946 domain-containing protein [Trinickia dabaoshanensis]|nr:DUF2946 domain-containing protein [Trinickia dabaoshanensis]